MTLYKRRWTLCHNCGDAHPTERDSLPLSFLPDARFKKTVAAASGMYDYFVSDEHIRWSLEEAQAFLSKHIIPNSIDLKGKRVLDVSGGNGHVAAEIARLGANVTLTEFNEPALTYAREKLSIPGFLYDFNSQRISDATQDVFDIVLLRAAIMFCRDLQQFANDLQPVTALGAHVIVNHSVSPTIGTLNRTQFDDFSYFALRQPENVIKTFENAGFSLVNRADEIDPDLYVWALDYNRFWYAIEMLYQQPAVQAIVRRERSGKPSYQFRARDRRRSTMIFKKRG
jgi:ubiquinone/menaquinone biosynthesis C-methylase UbiE